MLDVWQAAQYMAVFRPVVLNLVGVIYANLYMMAIYLIEMMECDEWIRD
jgi:hypothetical protein